MWCPRCHYVFVGEEERCFSCGKKLEKVIPTMPEGTVGYSYLITCQNEFDLSLKQGLLNTSGIQTIRTFVPKDVTIEIFTDHSEKHGLDLFVPTAQLSLAQELIKEQRIDE